MSENNQVPIATPKELAEENYHSAVSIQEELKKTDPDLKIIEKLCWNIRQRSHGIIYALEQIEVKETDNK